MAEQSIKSGVDLTWHHRLFGSGTQIVTTDTADEPHLYICGPNAGDETTLAHDRYAVCEDLQAFLNGGSRPPWLDDMDRISETVLVGADGSRIDAVGPMRDLDGKGAWDQDDTPEMQDKRARLIDRLQRKDTPNE